jgi:hypothetical protein
MSRCNCTKTSICDYHRVVELEKAVERLREALEQRIALLEREGCTSRGCDQGIHTAQCPMDTVLALEQALKGEVEKP